MPKYPAENVSMPRRDGLSASILNLSVGQSFLIPESDLGKNTRRIAHATAKRLNKPVSVRKVEEGLRVYRLKEWPRGEARHVVEAKKIAVEIDASIPEEDIDRSYDFG